VQTDAFFASYVPTAEIHEVFQDVIARPSNIGVTSCAQCSTASRPTLTLSRRPCGCLSSGTCRRRS
jgi:hypothetical protein